MIQRTVNGILVGIAILLALWLLPGWAIFLLLAGASCVAQAEFFAIMRQGGYASCPMLAYPLGVLWLLGRFAFAVNEAPAWMGGSSWELVLLGIFLFVLLVRLLFDPKAKPVEQAAITCFSFFYVPFLLGFSLPLATFKADRPFVFSPEGIFLVFYLILVVKMTDVGAFAIGCSCGRNKMFPRISPKKSWEGLAGGLAAAVLSSVALVALTKRFGWAAGATLGAWSLPCAAAVGLVLGVVGVLGDLFESMFKRAVNVKDSSYVVPGMGGFLDMFDSILFAPMVLFLFLKGTGAL
ncbi:MAG: phosphatidate cytidylyltransferase [Kiritimatiellia bacterium]|jgi:phosphatidate cytidylyltransferase